MEIILATHNDNKLKEINKLFKDTNIHFISLKDLNFKEEIEENGKTFKENAYVKAKTIYDKYHLPVVSDDSGLEVQALNNEPGIYSSRYANGNYQDAMKKILQRLGNTENKTADFNCSICYIEENGEVHYFEHKCFGKIGPISGESGFGYDPIFYYNGKSFANMTLEEKNQISHRGMAFKKFFEFMKNKK